MRQVLAQFGPGDDWIPALLGLFVLSIPIIAILTRHQQRMAEILRERHSAGQSDDVAALRADLNRLTQAVHQQTIALDDLRARSLPSSTAIPEDRLSSQG